MLCGVECDHANRVAILARDQIGDDGFEVGPLDIGLGKRGAKASEIIDDKINGLSVAACGRHDRRGPISAHENSQRYNVGNQKRPAETAVDYRRSPTLNCILRSSSHPRVALSLPTCCGNAGGVKMSQELARKIPVDRPG